MSESAAMDEELAFDEERWGFLGPHVVITCESWESGEFRLGYLGGDKMKFKDTRERQG